MPRRLFAALLFAAAPAAVVAQDAIDNPYKSAKVGDYANYSLTTKVGGFDVKGTITNTVVARTDTEVTVKVTGKMNGADIPSQEQKIDVTKAFDPTKAGMPGGKAGGDAKVETTGTGKEKLSLNGKSYDATWTTMKVKTKTPVGDVDADMKAWVGSAIPLGLGRLEMTMKVAGQDMKMEMVQTDSGNKK